MRRIQLPALLCFFLAAACNDNDKPKEFVADVTEISFAETVSGVVPFRSGSGTYIAGVVSGAEVVTPHIITGGYTYGAVRLDPHKPGQAVVEVTDSIIGQKIRIAVAVKELVYLFRCAALNTEIHAVGADLDDIRAKAEKLSAFGMGKHYVLSGRDGYVSVRTGADNRYEKVFDSSFGWSDTGDYDLILTNGDQSRTLAAMPAPYNQFGFNLLRQYALMFDGEGTRAGPPPDPTGEVLFVEDMSHYFTDIPGNIVVTAKYLLTGGPDAMP